MGWGHVERSPGLWTHIRASLGLCSPSADDGGAAQWGRAAHCQLWQPHVAAGLVPIRLERINLCFPRFCGTGGALMSPALQADVLWHLPVHKAFPKSQLAFARFPPPPLPAHSSPNAGVGTSHDMVSNQLLNSYFSWLSLEEAFQSLCLMPPELCSSRCLSSSVLLMGASRRPYTNKVLFAAGNSQGRTNSTQRCCQEWEPRRCLPTTTCSPRSCAGLLALLLAPLSVLHRSCARRRVPVLARLRCARCIAALGSFSGTHRLSAASCGSERSQGMQTHPGAAKPQLITGESWGRWKSRCLRRGCQLSELTEGLLGLNPTAR